MALNQTGWGRAMFLWELRLKELVMGYQCLGCRSGYYKGIGYFRERKAR